MCVCTCVLNNLIYVCVAEERMKINLPSKTVFFFTNLTLSKAPKTEEGFPKRRTVMINALLHNTMAGEDLLILAC